MNFVNILFFISDGYKWSFSEEDNYRTRSTGERPYKRSEYTLFSNKLLVFQLVLRKQFDKLKKEPLKYNCLCLQVNPIVGHLNFSCIVCFTSINVQKKNLKNPVFKSIFFFQMYINVWWYIRTLTINFKIFGSYLKKSYPLGLYVNFIFGNVWTA